MSEPLLTIVVPCYNEEEVLTESSQQLDKVLVELINQQQVSSKSKLLFVNDGSTDDTWKIIKELQKAKSEFEGISFSRNFGHQNALIAGMATANKYSDIIITIDADLQDDIACIAEMVEKYRAENDIVYAVRNDRKSDTIFKRQSAELFYWLMKKMGVNLVPNHSDYRLLSKRAVSTLLQYHEENLFLRAIVPTLGYKSDIVYYKRKERFAGTSHYPLKKMINFALDGITSFTISPIRIIMYLGLLIMLVSGLGLCALVGTYFYLHTVSGWTSIMVSIFFFSGFQLVTICIVGTYVGKTYIETKHRPQYIIEEQTFSATQLASEQRGDALREKQM
ncbi:MAG: glycosyltransferase family 2 protein [Liquorilactobacillus sp.]|uniref:glycosyltransferase family 2 protein n=1 Tax=Liquorilactobacillus sp. TaxID=2767923 RepID=UPI0039E953EF